MENNKTLFIERLKDNFTLENSKDHIDRYHFAKRFIFKSNIKTLLDCACGMGYGTKMLACSEGVKKIVGIDIDKDSITYAKNENFAPNIEFIRGDILEFESLSKFDCVISFETIEHIKEDRLFIQKVNKLLSKRGYLILSTPNGRVTNPTRGEPRNIYHVREYLPHELFGLVSPYFDICDVYGQYPKRPLANFMNFLMSFSPFIKFMIKIRVIFGLNSLFKKTLKSVYKDRLSVMKDSYKYSEVLILICRKK